MHDLKPPTETPYFSREHLEAQPTEKLLVLLPENWHIFKDSGAWTIGHMDTPEHDYHHPTRCAYDIRAYLIEFLLQYPFDGQEIEVTRYELQNMTRPGYLGASL